MSRRKYYYKLDNEHNRHLEGCKGDGEDTCLRIRESTMVCTWGEVEGADNYKNTHITENLGKIQSAVTFQKRGCGDTNSKIAYLVSEINLKECVELNSGNRGRTFSRLA